MSVDLEKLTPLQRTLAAEALETVPDGVTKFTINATDGGDSVKYGVMASPPFMLNDEAVAALREIFLLYRDGGDPLRGLTCEIAQKPDKSWGLAMEYDYLNP
jgi:hypothetical protein